MKYCLLFLLVGLMVTSCNDYSDKDMQSFDDKIASYVKKNKLEMIKSDSGLYYTIHEKGEGDSIKGDALISAIYTGRLLNGKIFDKQNKPTEMKLKDLIHGWREVAFYMNSGGKATIIVPPQLGYGSRKMNDIPKNSILIFDIEIVDVY